jgi:hypothetical protein
LQEIDSVDEVKVLTNSNQAEYGRSSGLQVIGITKSGTDHFHGSLHDFDQHSVWNSNSWANKLNGVTRPYSLTRQWGGTIGGPVGRPGHQNKLFWFLSEQVRPSSTGGTVNYFRVPTALERQGNFSQKRMTESSIYPFVEFVWNTVRERSTFRFFTWLERVRWLCVYDC